METILILIMALFLDLLLGELPNKWHPVAWLGKLIAWQTSTIPRKHKTAQLAYGIFMVLLTTGVITTGAYLFLFYLKEMNSLAYIITGGIMLKYTFSLRGLREAIDKVRKFLSGNNIDQARYSLSALVSRNTSSLNKHQIMSATIESSAENICDSFVAPLFYFLVFSIPGAIAYRIINTFDAMIGYHDDCEYSGKCAARLDDIVNFIPARLSALAIVIAAWLCRKNPSAAWHIMLRDHKKTESPNAGWTMSAIAGALGIQLEKPGHYRLGDSQQTLSANTINAALQIIVVTAIIWSLLSLLLEVLKFVAA